MMFVALLLGVFHLFLNIRYVFTGHVPEIVINVEHPTNLISALGLVVETPTLGICVGSDMECQGCCLHDCIIRSHCGGVSSRCVGRHHADSSMGTYRRGLSDIFHTLANQHGILGT